MEHAPCHHECTELCKLNYQDGSRQTYPMPPVQFNSAKPHARYIT